MLVEEEILSHTLKVIEIMVFSISFVLPLDADLLDHVHFHIMVRNHVQEATCDFKLRVRRVNYS